MTLLLPSKPDQATSRGGMRYPLDLSSLAPYEHLIGGFCSGVASTAVCHPLDLLKTRFSANEGNPLRPQYNSYSDATLRIVRAEGVRGLYQGLTPNMTGAALAWGLYFQLYHEIKSVVPVSHRFETTANFGFGMLAGACVMCVTNPIWVTKTRLFLQYETAGPKKYSGMFDCLRQIRAQEGIAGLYRGFLVGIIGTTHGALQFMVYNWMKDWLCRAKGIEKDSAPSNLETTFCSTVSKIIATTAIFPYQVIRTRIQDHNVQSGGIIETVRRTLAKEGLSGLYKGCLMANVRVLPAAVVTFVTYENVRHYIKGLGHK